MKPSVTRLFSCQNAREKQKKSVCGLPLVPHDLSWCYTDVVLYLELDYLASL